MSDYQAYTSVRRIAWCGVAFGAAGFILALGFIVCTLLAGS